MISFINIFICVLAVSRVTANADAAEASGVNGGAMILSEPTVLIPLFLFLIVVALIAFCSRRNANEDSDYGEQIADNGVFAEPKAQQQVENESIKPAKVIFSGPIILESDVDDNLKAVIDGEVVFIRYRSSFQSRLIQAGDDIQGYYTAIKNKLMSYSGVKSRTSWNFDSFNKQRIQCAKLNVKGKALFVYLNLDCEKYNAAKYHFQNVGDKPKFRDVPMFLKVKSDRGLKYALELIEEMMRDLEIPEGKVQNVDYRTPYRATDELAREGLVKIILPVGMTLDENLNLVKTNVTRLLDGKESPIKEKAVIADGNLPNVVEHAHVKPEDVVHVDAIHADAMLSDSEAELAIEHIHTDVATRGGKLVEINLDVICENFEDGETVTLDALKERCFVSKDAGRVKVLARGTMTKALTIVAYKFSLQAVKMITLAGGVAEIEE